MGLINNGLRRAGPSTVYGIGTASLRLPQVSAGAMRIRYACTEGVSRVIGVPSGYGPPIAWSIPQKGGSMVCRASSEATAAGSLAGGVNITCDMTGTLTTTGTGAAIAGMTCAMAGALTTTGTITGIAGMTCSMAGGLTAAGTIGAIAHATCDIECILTTTAAPGAVGHMSCELLADPGAELSADDIADAVWSFGTRELTAGGGGGGASAADIWSYATRALTASGVTAVQAGLATSSGVTALPANVWTYGTRELTPGGVAAIQAGLASADPEGTRTIVVGDSGTTVPLDNLINPFTVYVPTGLFGALGAGRGFACQCQVMGENEITFVGSGGIVVSYLGDYNAGDILILMVTSPTEARVVRL